MVSVATANLFADMTEHERRRFGALLTRWAKPNRPGGLFFLFSNKKCSLAIQKSRNLKKRMAGLYCKKILRLALFFVYICRVKS